MRPLQRPNRGKASLWNEREFLPLVPKILGFLVGKRDLRLDLSPRIPPISPGRQGARAMHVLPDRSEVCGSRNLSSVQRARPDSPSPSSSKVTMRSLEIYRQLTRRAPRARSSNHEYIYVPPLTPLTHA